MQLILASQSASRRSMLEAAGVAHLAVASDIDEDPIKRKMENAASSELALTLAEAKALDVAQSHLQNLVLGGDSIASVNGVRFSKPKDRDDAKAHLQIFSGQLLMLTSAAVLVRQGAVRARICDEARLQVRHLSDAFVEHYLEAEWPAISGCAGCFRIEAMGVQLFERVDGDHFTILGMPLLGVLAALRTEGMLVG